MGRVAQAALDWDVPVRLVPLRLAPDAGGWSTVRIDPGVALPGVAALDATTLTIDGLTLLARLDPVATGMTRGTRATRASGAPTQTLAVLLAALRQQALDSEALSQDGSVPVAVDGSPFTLAVLAALTRVPVGARCTYAELATAAGRPRAVRAAASVMARNRVPLVLPCHRVVPSSGGTGRYGWGEHVKVALLAAEATVG
jgi:methylated-DNA-[protein]-cysteine S-methyltransferase